MVIYLQPVVKVPVVVPGKFIGIGVGGGTVAGIGMDGGKRRKGAAIRASLNLILAAGRFVARRPVQFCGMWSRQHGGPAVEVCGQDDPGLAKEVLHRQPGVAVDGV